MQSPLLEKQPSDKSETMQDNFADSFQVIETPTFTFYCIQVLIIFGAFIPPIYTLVLLYYQTLEAFITQGYDENVLMLSIYIISNLSLVQMALIFSIFQGFARHFIYHKLIQHGAIIKFKTNLLYKSIIFWYLIIFSLGLVIMEFIFEKPFSGKMSSISSTSTTVCILVSVQIVLLYYKQVFFVEEHNITLNDFLFNEKSNVKSMYKLLSKLVVLKEEDVNAVCIRYYSMCRYYNQKACCRKLQHHMVFFDQTELEQFSWSNFKEVNIISKSYSFLETEKNFLTRYLSSSIWAEMFMMSMGKYFAPEDARISRLLLISFVFGLLTFSLLINAIQYI